MRLVNIYVTVRGYVYGVGIRISCFLFVCVHVSVADRINCYLFILKLKDFSHLHIWSEFERRRKRYFMSRPSLNGVPFIRPSFMSCVAALVLSNLGHSQIRWATIVW